MSILSGNEIKRQVLLGNINITPFNESQLNPVSYDLTLGNNYKKYKDYILDSRKNNETIEYNNFRQVLCHPNYQYLMCTVERIQTNMFVPIIDGKSSIGRLFTFIHVTAGYGDPGFDGNYTLEVVCMKPIILYTGMKIAQIRFMTIEGNISLYNGNYKNENAVGCIGSRSYKQFT